MLKPIASSITLSLLLAGCGSDSDSSSKSQIKAPAVNLNGATLPYTVLRDDLVDPNTQQTFEIRNGGYGSAATAHPTIANQFYALTDRGANATYTCDYGKGKKFPTPGYTPRIGLFAVAEDGTVHLIDVS